MQCYFHGLTQDDDPLVKCLGTVSFAVPDIGVIFRSRWMGNLYECQYAALLSLLQFIDTNEKVFKGEPIDIYSDSPVVIYQLTKGGPIIKPLMKLYQTVVQYKSKISFKLNWIPQQENPACHGLSDVPPLKPSVEITFESREKGKKQLRRGGSLSL
jgi:hypothetical protein